MFKRGVKKLYTCEGSSFGCGLGVILASFGSIPLDVDGFVEGIFGIQFVVCYVGGTNVIVATLFFCLHFFCGFWTS